MVFAGVVKEIIALVSAQTPPTHASLVGVQLTGLVHAVAGEPFSASSV